MEEREGEEVNHYPTPEHEAAAAAITGFFRGREGVRAVLLTNSCARGKASRDSCLDMAILTAPDARIQSQLNGAWESFGSTDRAIAEMAAVGAFSHVDLGFIDGEITPRKRGWTSGPDGFELEIGNYVAYSVALWERESEMDALREKWLPYYGEDLRQERLAAARKYCINNLEHIPLFVARGLHFQAFDRLYMAHREFLQALFIAKRTYPIAYDKWIREQLVDMLGLPDIYAEVVDLLQIRSLESDELAGKAEALRSLLDTHAPHGPVPAH